MTNCGRYFDALVDHALGSPLDEGARPHVADCDMCARTLARLRDRVAAIDMSLTKLGAAEPGPHLRARIAAAIASNGPATPAVWRRLALAGACSIVMLASASVLFWPRSAQPPTGASDVLTAAAQLARWRSPTDVLLAPYAAHSTPSTGHGPGGNHAG